MINENLNKVYFLKIMFPLRSSRNLTKMLIKETEQRLTADECVNAGIFSGVVTQSNEHKP